jgi:hypothetical protein
MRGPEKIVGLRTPMCTPIILRQKCIFYVNECIIWSIINKNYINRILGSQFR